MKLGVQVETRPTSFQKQTACTNKKKSRSRMAALHFFYQRIPLTAYHADQPLPLAA